MALADGAMPFVLADGWAIVLLAVVRTTAKNHIDVREELLRFHNSHYFAQQMRLAVLGRSVAAESPIQGSTLDPPAATPAVAAAVLAVVWVGHSRFANLGFRL